MDDRSIASFRESIFALFDAHSCFERRAHVREELDDGGVWEADVVVFTLLDHPRSPKCYCWEKDGELTIVLHDDVVQSPEGAVRAALAEETGDDPA
jgi:hypothetical protein